MKALLLAALLGLAFAAKAGEKPARGVEDPYCDVGVAKSGPSQMIIGFPDPYVYQVNIANAGPFDAENVTMTDQVPLPFQVVAVRGSYSNGTISCNFTGNLVTCSLEYLRNKDAARVFIDVRLPSNAIPGQVNNTARVTSDTPDVDPTNQQNTHRAQIVASADLAINIEGPGAAIAGQQDPIDSTILVQNLGFSDANDVVSTFQVPSQMVFQSVDNPACNYNDVTRIVTCSFGTLQTNETRTFLVQMTVESNAPGGDVELTARVNSTTPDPQTQNNQDTHVVRINVDSNISVTKSGPLRVTAGQQEDEAYNIVVENSGPSDGLVVVMSDPIPVEWTLLPASWVCNFTQPSGAPLTKREDLPCANSTISCSSVVVAGIERLRCEISYLSVNERVAFTVPFTVNDDAQCGNVVNNTARVTSQTPDSDQTRNEDSHQTTIDCSADVRVNKVCPLVTIISGDGITYYYSVTVTNGGPSAAVNVQSVDALPAPMVPTGPVEFVQGTGSCNIDGSNVVRCSYGTMARGASVTWRVPIIVPANAQTVGQIVNSVSVNSTTPDPNTNNNVDSCATSVVAAPDVGVTKAGPGVIYVNDDNTYFYNIRVRNYGPSDAQNGRIEDEVPDAFVVQDPITTTRGTCSRVGNNVTCELGYLENGADISIAIPIKVSPSVVAGGQTQFSVSNTVFVYHTTPDRDPTNNNDTASTILIREADVAVAKGGPTVVCAGDPEQRFTVTVENLGPSDATGVTLTDQLPVQFQMGAGAVTIQGNRTSASCSFVNRLLSCQLGGMAFGDIIRVTYPFVVTPGTPPQTDVPNTARIATTSVDPNPNNDADTHLTDICGRADLRIQKVAPVTVTAGQGFGVYSLSVQNVGPSNAVNAVVTDIVPQPFQFVPGSITSVAGGNCSYTPATRLVRCEYNVMPVGASDTITFQFTVGQAVQAQDVLNCAEITSNTPDPSTPNRACDTTTVLVLADIAVQKTGPNQLCAGAPGSTFVMTVNNNGPSRATQVQLTDVFPSEFTPGAQADIVITGAEAGASCTLSGQSLSCSLGGMDVGDTVQVQVPFRILASVTSTVAINVVRVSATTADGVTSNDQAQWPVNICRFADMAIEKAGPASVGAGSTGHQYVLTVRNNGQADAINVVVRDPIPFDFPLNGDVTATGGGQCELLVIGGQTTVVCRWARFVPAQVEEIRIPFEVPAGTAAGVRRNCGIVASDTTDPVLSNNQDCTDTTVDVVADLSVTKTGPSIVCAGEGTVHYFTATVSNAGPAVAVNVQMDDPIPPQFTVGAESDIVIVGNQTAASCSLAGQSLTCSLGNMNVGASIQVRYPFTVAASVPAQLNVINTVTVSATTADGQPLNNQASHATDICANADLRVAKTGTSVATAGLGGYFYSINVWNVGPANAVNARITDEIPIDFNPQEPISVDQGGSCSFESDGAVPRPQITLVCLWPSFSVGANASVTFGFDVIESAAPGTRINCVDATSDVNDPTSGTRACHPTEVITRADMDIVKRGPASVCAGTGQRFFTLDVRNFGPSVAQVVSVTDRLNDVFTPGDSSDIEISNVGGVSGVQQCAFNGQLVQCTFGAMTPGGSVRIRVPFSVAAGVPVQTVSNTGVVSSSTTDPNLTNNDFTIPVEICANADLVIEKTGPSTVTADGSSIYQFQLTVNNLGPADAQNVVVTDDDLPVADITIVDVVSNLGVQCEIIDLQVLPPGRRVQCSYPTHPVGVVHIITIRFTSPTSAVAGARENCALVAATTNDPNQNNNRDCVPYTVVTLADLVTTKSCPSVVTAGSSDTYQYVITVTNAGLSDAVDARMSDTVPNAFAVPNGDIATTVGTCSAFANIVQCQFGAMAPGASATVTVPFTVPATTAVGRVDNTACATTTSPETNPNNNCFTCGTDVVCDAQLRITKTDSRDTVVAGSPNTYEYLIEVTNEGPTVSRDTVVTDTFPDAFTFVDATTNIGGPCAETATGFLCNVGNLLVGQTATVRARYRVAANVPPQTVVNTACASNSCNESPVCATDSTVVQNSADLVIVKDDCVDEVEAGSSTQYVFSIEVTNLGPSMARNVEVTDPWPSQYTLEDVATDAPGVCTLTVTGFTCNWPQLSPGASVLIRATYTVPASTRPGLVTNCVSVTSTTPDPNTENNQDCDTNRVVAFADLEILKTIDSPDCVVAGSLVSRTYTLTVNNLGPVTAVNTVVREYFPEGIDVFSWPSECAKTPADQSYNFTCQLGDMAPGDSVMLFFLFRAPSSHPGGIIENVATVESDTPDPVECNNRATLCSEICLESELAVTKTDNVVEVIAGDGVTYTYVVTGFNNGPSDARNVVFTDYWPAQFLRGEVTADGAEVTITDVFFKVTVPVVPAGSSYSFTVTYTVPACLEACSVCNAVTIQSDARDPVAENNAAQDCNLVRTVADVEICKTDGVDSVVAGDGVLYTYSVHVKNNGPSCAQKVNVRDHFPAEVERVGVVSTSTGSCADIPDSKDFACNLATLQPGQEVIITVSYNVPSSTETCSVTNVATVSSITYDPEVCNNDAKDVNVLREEAQLTVAKTDNRETILVDDRSVHTYSITVTNQGPSSAKDVIVTDHWPGAFVQFQGTIQAPNNTECVSSGGDFTCRMSGSLDRFEQLQIMVSFSLMDNVPCNTNIRNGVTAFSPTDTECREAADVTQVICPPANDVQAAAPEEDSKKREVKQRATERKHSAKVAAPRPRVLRPKNKNVLSPKLMRVEVKSADNKKDTFSVRLENHLKRDMVVQELSLVVQLKNGKSVSVDATSESKYVKSTSCHVASNRRLSSKWTAECSVTLAESKDVSSVKLVTKGFQESKNGFHPVMGSAAMRQ